MDVICESCHKKCTPQYFAPTWEQTAWNCYQCFKTYKVKTNDGQRHSSTIGTDDQHRTVTAEYCSGDQGGE
jgi:hypothetical protein